MIIKHTNDPTLLYKVGEDSSSTINPYIVKNKAAKNPETQSIIGIRILFLSLNALNYIMNS